MWLKICGMTTPEAVAAALDAGVDALGFVFADSVRQVTPEMAARLAAPARGRVRCVAVTRHPGQQALDDILAGFKPDVLQTDAVDLPLLRLPTELELLPVLRGRHDEQSALPGRVLFEGLASGAGMPCDWITARRVARRTELVLAGGLNAANVASAIAAVQPFGVDVSSGVEARPGVKDPAEIAKFAAAVRSTAPQSSGTDSKFSSRPNTAGSQSGESAEQSRRALEKSAAHEDPV
ncbi:MAG: phosphoribosylanthranilate isomerase [Gammaproteobacteria bacterium]|nr:phosphoribosylanthranilate isomerase [Gammaproteobacteria bacterium]